MSRAIAAILALLLVSVGGVYGFQAALADAGERTDISAETWTPNAGSVTTLDHSNLADTYYDEQVDVRDGSGNTVDEGVDYIWYENNGTIKAVTGGALDGASSAEIDYGYNRPSSEQQNLAGMMGQVPGTLGLLAPLFVALIAFKLIT